MDLDTTTLNLQRYSLQNIKMTVHRLLALNLN